MRDDVGQMTQATLRARWAASRA